MSIEIIESIENEYVDCIVGGVDMHVVLHDCGEIDYYLGNKESCVDLDDNDYTEHMETISDWLTINMPFEE